MKWLLSELQRRQVTRVAASYVVAGWILLQVSASLENALTLPSWFDTAVLLLLVAGFPLAVTIAWMFELTPDGLRRTVGFGDGVPVRPQATDWLLIGMLAVTGAVAAGLALTSRVGGLPSDRSVAVLPFENRSPNIQDEGYGDWLSELVSSLLGKADGLRVTSQTSASMFKGQAVALPEIARQLGVSMVVEGSVRSEGDEIVISAQLINAETDTQMWADVYHRESGNALGVQSEVAATVAGAVAEALEVSIAEREKQALTPRAAPKAIEAYQNALKLYRTTTEANVRTAQRLLNEAVEADRDFALAWALLSRVHSWFHFNRSEATESRRAAAEHALAEALRLEPDLAEVKLAAAYLEYWVKRDFDGARVKFDELIAKWPNNADVLTALASIVRRQGQWEESKNYFERAVAIDPLRPGRRVKAAELSLATRDFEGALRQIDASVEYWPKAPDSLPFIAKKALVLQALGRLDEAGAILQGLTPEPDGELLEPVVYQALLTRKPAEAIAVLRELLGRDRAGGSPGRASVDLNIYLGNLSRLAGDEAGARKAYREARGELQAELARQPDNADWHSYLALALSGLGDHKAARNHADKAVTSVPVEKDALSGAYYLDVQARVLARAGERAAAVAAIERLMKLPAPLPLTPALLRRDPDFDLLRREARFVALAGRD